MAAWTLALGSAVGQTELDLQTLGGVRLRFPRNGVPEVTFTLGLFDAALSKIAGSLADGLPTLLGYRRRTPEATGTLRFAGRWAPMREDTSDPTAAGQVKFAGPAANLEHRFTAASVPYPATDAGQIAWDLIDTANAEAPTGIVLGDIEATVARDRTYEDKQLLEAIVQLTEVQGGFDFEVTPLDPAENAGALGEFHVYADQGSDRTDTAIFEYGSGTAGNVRNVRRNWLYPVNKVRVIGDGIRSEDSDAASIAKYGLWMQAIQEADVSVQATLDAKATAALRPEPIRIVAFDPEPGLCPEPFEDFWLGDTVAFRADEGSMQEDLTPEVDAIVIELDASGNEVGYELEYANAEGLGRIIDRSPHLPRQVKALRADLARIERRVLG